MTMYTAQWNGYKIVPSCFLIAVIRLLHLKLLFLVCLTVYTVAKYNNDYACLLCN